MTEDQKKLKETVIAISGVDPSKCMTCGKCSGTCQAYDEMEYHPHQFVGMVKQGRIKELMSSESLWRCLSCYACVERCPRGVEPVKLIEAVRLMVIRAKDENHFKAQDLPVVLDENMPQQAIVSAFRKYGK
ncbi:MAG: 4Fe-4S dicluster domain-containing protein [Christensenella sp.]